MDNPVRWSVRWLLVAGGLGLAYVVVVMTLALFGGPHMDPTVVAVIIATLAVFVLLAGNATVAGAARDRATVHFDARFDAVSGRDEAEAMRAGLDRSMATLARQLQALADAQGRTAVATHARIDGLSDVVSDLSARVEHVAGTAAGTVKELDHARGKATT
jgi:hypothetical protein